MLPRDKEPDLPPDPVIEAYKKDIDRTLLRETLKRTVEPNSGCAPCSRCTRPLTSSRGPGERPGDGIRRFSSRARGLACWIRDRGRRRR